MPDFNPERSSGDCGATINDDTLAYFTSTCHRNTEGLARGRRGVGYGQALA